MADGADELIQRVRAGDETAIAELVERLHPYIRQVARRRLNGRLRTTADSTDFVQQVWASFLAKSHAFDRCSDADDLRQYLGRVAANQVAEAVRAATAEKRGGLFSRRPLTDETAGNDTDDSPSETLLGAERRERLLHGMSESERSAVAYLEQGFTRQEAASLSGVPFGSLRRVIDRARRRESQRHGRRDE